MQRGDVANTRVDQMQVSEKPVMIAAFLAGTIGSLSFHFTRHIGSQSYPFLSWAPLGAIDS